MKEKIVAFKDACGEIADMCKHMLLYVVGFVAMGMACWFAYYGMQHKQISWEVALLLAGVIEGSKIALTFWFWKHLQNPKASIVLKVLVTVMLAATAVQSWNYSRTYLADNFTKDSAQIQKHKDRLVQIEAERKQANDHIAQSNEIIRTLSDQKCATITKADGTTDLKCSSGNAKQLNDAKREQKEAKDKLVSLSDEERAESQSLRDLERGNTDAWIFMLIAAFVELASFLVWWAASTKPLTDEEAEELEKKRLEAIKAAAVAEARAKDDVRFEQFITVHKALEAAAQMAKSSAEEKANAAAKSADAAEKASRAALAAVRIRKLAGNDEQASKDDLIAAAEKALNENDSWKEDTRVQIGA